MTDRPMQRTDDAMLATARARSRRWLAIGAATWAAWCAAGEAPLAAGFWLVLAPLINLAWLDRRPAVALLARAFHPGRSRRRLQARATGRRWRTGRALQRAA